MLYRVLGFGCTLHNSRWSKLTQSHPTTAPYLAHLLLRDIEPYNFIIAICLWQLTASFYTGKQGDMNIVKKITEHKPNNVVAATNFL